MLTYRAGPRALAELRQGGDVLAAVAAWVGSASGPRWLALHGLDRALLASGLLAGGGQRRLLLGASAGGWRALALASPDPQAALDRLLDGYVAQTFARDARPAAVSVAYRQMLAEVFPAAEHDFVVANPGADLVLVVTRTAGLAAIDGRWRQLLGLALVAGSRRLRRRLLQRGAVATAPDRLAIPAGAAVARLSTENLPAAALATGSVPLYMTAVRDLPGLPPGAWRDGGLTDYHLAHRWQRGPGLTLLPHFAVDVLPTWFDQRGRRRPPLPEVADDLLVVARDATWIASLPDRRLPHRDDFLTFAERPAERRRRWLEVARRAHELGDQLGEDLATGAIARKVQLLAGAAST